jgi:hypothetical protein
MKTCPVCREQFEDELRFCTFDGSPLPGARKSKPDIHGRTDIVIDPDEYAASPAHNGWRTAFFLLLALMFTGAAIATAYFLMQPRTSQAGRTSMQSSLITPTSIPTEPTPAPEAVAKEPALHEMTRQELMAKLPKNLLRRFHAGETSQGTPDDLRVVSAETGEYVVLLGSGRIEGSVKVPAQRILILKYEENDFRDSTSELLPASYRSGAVAGRGAQVRFSEGGHNVIVREPASKSSVVNECASCDRAYQVLTLEWKNGKYVESGRAWENDRYTVFYVVADALEKKKVDPRARPFVEKSLDPIITQGFTRSGKDGWTVEWRADDEESASYELIDESDRLMITLSRVNGQWKAVQIVN